MAVGVATANAILLVTFAERARVGGMTAREAGVEGARARVRPILMTSCAMIAGMVPMALGLGEGGDQIAPLGRAVIGGLAAGTLTTLFVLPAVFALVMGRAGHRVGVARPVRPGQPALRPGRHAHRPGRFPMRRDHLLLIAGGCRRAPGARVQPQARAAGRRRGPGRPGRSPW